MHVNVEIYSCYVQFAGQCWCRCCIAVFVDLILTLNIDSIHLSNEPLSWLMSLHSVKVKRLCLCEVFASWAADVFASYSPQLKICTAV